MALKFNDLERQAKEGKWKSQMVCRLTDDEKADLDRLFEGSASRFDALYELRPLLAEMKFPSQKRKSVNLGVPILFADDLKKISKETGLPVVQILLMTVRERLKRDAAKNGKVEQASSKAHSGKTET